MQDAAFVATLCAAFSALPVARRRRSYLPVAAFLWYVLLSDLARQQLIGRVVKPAKEAMRAAGIDPLGATFSPVVIGAAHLEHALYMGSLVGVATAGMIVFLSESGRPFVATRSVVATGIGWLTVSAIMVLSYPRIRGHQVETTIYLPVAVGSIIATCAAVVPWLRRRLSVQVEHLAVGLLAAINAVEGVTLLDRPARWDLAVGSCLVVYSFLAAMHGGWLWWSSSSRAR